MTARQQIARLLPLVLLFVLVIAGLRGVVAAPGWNGPSSRRDGVGSKQLLLRGREDGGRAPSQARVMHYGWPRGCGRLDARRSAAVHTPVTCPACTPRPSRPVRSAERPQPQIAIHEPGALSGPFQPGAGTTPRSRRSPARPAAPAEAGARLLPDVIVGGSSPGCLSRHERYPDMDRAPHGPPAPAPDMHGRQQKPAPCR